jgi:hypothetical protein
LTAPDIAGALALALEAVKDERELHAAMLDRLAALASTAVQRFEAGDRQSCHDACKQALDLAHDALGDCEALEPLCAMLGYSDEPGTVLS